jgi:hypothetical protein
MYDWHYTNPYDRTKDLKNWMRWNVGEEHGSGGMQPVGKSVAYKSGYNVGRYHLLLISQVTSSEETKRQ